MEKAREFQKNIYFCFLDYAKAFDCVDHNKLWKILKEMGNTRPPDLPLEKPICRSGSKLELDMEQQTGSKSRKEYVKAVYCHHAYLTHMQSTSWETLGWMKHKLKSRLPEKYQYPHIHRLHYPYKRKRRRTKEPLHESERGEWKSWLKTKHSKN